MSGIYIPSSSCSPISSYHTQATQATQLTPNEQRAREARQGDRVLDSQADTLSPSITHKQQSTPLNAAAILPEPPVDSAAAEALPELPPLQPKVLNNEGDEEDIKVDESIINTLVNHQETKKNLRLALYNNETRKNILLNKTVVEKMGGKVCDAEEYTLGKVGRRFVIISNKTDDVYTLGAEELLPETAASFKFTKDLKKIRQKISKKAYNRYLEKI